MAANIVGACYLGDIRAGDIIAGFLSVQDGDGQSIHPDLSGSSMVVYRRSDFTSITATGNLLNNGGGGTSGIIWTIDTTQDGTFFADASDEFSVFIQQMVAGITTITEFFAGSFSIKSRSPLMPFTKGRLLAVDATNYAGADVQKIQAAAVSTNAAQLGVNIVNVGAAALNTSAAKLGVNVVNVGAAAVQQAGGYLKVSAGTGTGQLNLSAGRIGVNWADVTNPSTTVNLSGTTVAANTAGDALAAAIKVRTDLIPAVPAYGVQKGASFGPWPLVLRQLIDPRMPLTGATVTAEVSLDGAAFVACTNAVTEIASGAYKHTLAAADTNANKSVLVKYTAPGAITEFLTLLVTP